MMKSPMASGNMERVRLGVIGAGQMGEKHARLVRSCEGCELVGICDADPARKAVADALGVPFYRSAEELIGRERPSGAIIATPNALHAPAAVACAERSVHALVEKPIAETLSQALRIVEAAKAHRVAVLVGHHRRHSPCVRAARELVRGGTLGRLIGVSAMWTVLKPDAYFQTAWRRERPGGGPLLINLIHDLDSLRFICGDVTRVYAQTSAAARGFEVEDSLSASLTFESGALGTILASDATAAAWSYEATTAENPLLHHTAENCYHFVGTAASLAFPRMELWRYPDGQQKGWNHRLETQRMNVVTADPLKVQLDHFCRVVRGEEQPAVSAEEGTRSLALALAVRQSSDAGIAVSPATLLAGASSER